MAKIVKDLFPKEGTKVVKDLFPSAKGKVVEDLFDKKENLLLKNIKEHPFKSFFGGIAKTATGKSLEERAFEATKPTHIEPGNKLDYIGKFLTNALSGMAGSVADMATTPATYVPLPVGKLLGKIPVGKTTLGKVATQLPLKKLGNVGGMLMR